MKCVCPMGGDRTCPDDCPLAVWASLSPTDRKAQRKPVAERLYGKGFTMEAIATQLGVTKMTISNDLRDCKMPLQSKPAKTATNPKGAGRPKGKRSQRTEKGTPEQRKRAANLFLDEGKSRNEVAVTTGLTETVIREAVAREEGRREAEPMITPDMLSMTAQQKFEAAIRKREREIEQRLRSEIRSELQAALQKQLDQYNENARHYEIVLKRRNGIMTKAEYRSILSCLHPDRTLNEAEKRRYAHAFNLFSKLEKAVLSEKESSTKPSDLPKTVEELLKRRAAYDADRSTRRRRNIARTA